MYFCVSYIIPENFTIEQVVLFCLFVFLFVLFKHFKVSEAS